MNTTIKFDGGDPSFESLLQEQSIITEQDVGIVVEYSDGMCTIAGIFGVMAGEQLLFDSGANGFVFDIHEELVFAFILQKDMIVIGEGVKRTKQLYSIAADEKLLGRVIDIQGVPVDGLESIIPTEKSELMPVESEAKGIIERAPVTKPLYTGIISVDSLIAIGKGQRQLLIGNRGSGKTSFAITTILNQKNRGVICIYVAIGISQQEIARITHLLHNESALDYTVIVLADAGKPAIHHYLAPYVGSAIAEYFAHTKKRDVLIIYDDLSNQAISYRELCLLMKRPPAREAYPGDIFYLHSRLLERAGNFLHGGSITALPIIKLQENDVTAYIPTNVISITDGQIFFDTTLFNRGIKPAINIELSVSRVGGNAQPQIINTLSKALRLNIAQYHELSIFSQLGSEIDGETKQILRKGELLLRLLQQSLYQRYTVAEEAILLYAFRNHSEEFLKIRIDDHFFSWMLDFIRSTQNQICTLIEEEGKYNDEIAESFDNILKEVFLLESTFRETIASARSSAG